MLTFGVSIDQALAMNAAGDFDAERYAAVIVEAERVGFDHAFAPDHVFVPPYLAKIIKDTWIDPFTLLSYIAAKTSRIELVLACLVVPYRQPFTTAKAVATLDQLSGGRFALGVVPGYLEEEFETFNLPLSERGAMTNEFIRLMVEIWTSDAATFEGQYYRCKGINVKPRCARRPHVPIWVGGSSKSAIQRVVAFGDVWHPIGFTVIDDKARAANGGELDGKALPSSGTTPERLRQDLEYATRLADQSGRDLSSLQVVILPGPPPDAGVRVFQTPKEKALDLAARPDRMVDWLGRYIDAGATGFVVVPPADSLDSCVDYLRAYAAEVMPLLNQRTAAKEP
jgi:probable F420-dependent oxidoreductase